MGDNDILTAATSDISGRTALVAEESHSVWLYLSFPRLTRPEISCWILNTPDAPAVPDFTAYRRQSSPPPLPAALLTSSPPDPHRGSWSLRWSADGDAVAALLDERPVAFVIAGRARGYARYVTNGADPWALPWDAALFAATFDVV